MKKESLIWLIVSIHIFFFLSGCIINGFETQDLMSPPKPTGDKAYIQEAIEKAVGKDITLKYPNRGENRSPITMVGLKGDGSQQAVAFYSDNTEKSGTHMIVIDKVDGLWQAVGDFQNQGTDVDKFCFGDVDNDGKNEIIVGWNISNSKFNNMSVYYYEDGEMHEVKTNEVYTEFIMMDFDDDKGKDIFLLSLSDHGIPATAELIKLDSKKDSLHTIGVVPLNPEAIGYLCTKFGKISENQDGIVIDEIFAGDKVSTEIVYWDKGKKTLVNPMHDFKANSEVFIKRDSSVLSQDINNDSIIEIPVLTPMLGYHDQKDDSSCYITSWLQYDVKNSCTNSVCNMIINNSEGYYFKIPFGWENKITAKIDKEAKSLTFSEWVINDENVGAAGAIIFSIQVFSQSDWDKKDKADEFIVLAQQNDKVYTALISQPSGTLSINRQQIEECFALWD